MSFSRPIQWYLSYAMQIQSGRTVPLSTKNVKMLKLNENYGH